MTTQSILARVNEIIDLVREVPTALIALNALAGDLEAQLRSEIANSKGVGNALKTVVKLLDGAKKDNRESLAYPWVDAQGRQCVCNGFEAYRLRTHLPLPERPENISPGIDLDRVFPDDTTGWHKLPMPSAKELREFIAIERAKFTGKRSEFAPLWDFGPHEPSVNAFWLLDAVTVFPNAAELFRLSIFSPLYLTCEEGDAVVMPCRVQGKTQPPPTSDDESKAFEAQKAREERNKQQDVERRQIISKAHSDHDKANEDAKTAAAAILAAQDDMKNAKDDADKDSAMQRYYDAAESFGRARIRAVAAWQVIHPDDALTTEEFEFIVKHRYARDYVA